MYDYDVNEYPVKEKKTQGRRGKTQKPEPKIETSDIVKELHTLNVEVISKTKDNKTGVNFKGFGVFVNTDNKQFKIGDTIKVSYTSEIGKNDFNLTLAD